MSSTATQCDDAVKWVEMYLPRIESLIIGDWGRNNGILRIQATRSPTTAHPSQSHPTSFSFLLNRRVESKSSTQSSFPLVLHTCAKSPVLSVVLPTSPINVERDRNIKRKLQISSNLQELE